MHPAVANQVPPHPSRHPRPSPQHQEAEQSQHNDQHDGQQQQESEKGKGRLDGVGEGGASAGAPKAQWRSGSGGSALGASVGLTHSAAIVIIGDELLSGKVRVWLTVVSGVLNSGVPNNQFKDLAVCLFGFVWVLMYVSACPSVCVCLSASLSQPICLSACQAGRQVVDASVSRRGFPLLGTHCALPFVSDDLVHSTWLLHTTGALRSHTCPCRSLLPVPSHLPHNKSISSCSLPQPRLFTVSGG